MAAILFIFFMLVYILSIVGMAHIYDTKDLYLSFWAFVLILLPLVNTIAFIVLYDDWEGIKDFFSLRGFINDLKNT